MNRARILGQLCHGELVVEPESHGILGQLVDIDGLLDVRRRLLEAELDGPLRQPAAQGPIDIVGEVAMEEIGHLPPSLGECPARRAQIYAAHQIQTAIHDDDDLGFLPMGELILKALALHRRIGAEGAGIEDDIAVGLVIGLEAPGEQAGDGEIVGRVGAEYGGAADEQHCDGGRLGGIRIARAPIEQIRGRLAIDVEEGAVEFLGRQDARAKQRLGVDGRARLDHEIAAGIAQAAQPRDIGRIRRLRPLDLAGVIAIADVERPIEPGSDEEDQEGLGEGAVASR
jgi:hypothetical protein